MELEWGRMAAKGLRSGLEGAQHEDRKGLLREALAGKGNTGERTLASRKRHRLPVSPQGTQVTMIILPGPGTPLLEKT